VADKVPFQKNNKTKIILIRYITDSVSLLFSILCIWSNTDFPQMYSVQRYYIF